MKVSLIDIEVDGVRIFKEEKFYINFRNESKVFEEEKKKNVVSKLSGNNYKNNIITLAGINASGKTSSLYLINFVLMVFIMGRGLNFDKKIAPLLINKTTIKIHFMVNKKIYYLESEISKERIDGESILKFVEEKVYSKVVNSQVSNKNFLEKSNFEQNLFRSELESTEKGIFLKEEDSIFPAIFKEEDVEIPRDYVLDTLSSTDMNFLFAFTGSDVNIIQYLDDSIEELKLNIDESKEDKQPHFILKFYEDEPKEVSLLGLTDYLSSGTIKGLSFFAYIRQVLNNGGYLLVDELEIHFNKAIVENIISFFQSEANSNGATLIFSTHYSELLDRIERKEAVKILRKKDKKIQIDDLAALSESKKKNRSDVKNSDLILSGIFGTAPSYDKYWKVYKDLRNLTNGDPIDEK